MAIRRVNVDGKTFDISYEIFNRDKEKNIIFLHGWGSSKEVMKVFKNDFDEFRLIFLDMPGFGRSSNSYVLDTFDYAKVVDTFLKDLNISKDIIISHSFGGKVGLLLKPKLLVLLASAGIILEKPMSVRIKIYLFKLLKTLGLGKFRDKFVSSDVKGMSENMYETFKRVVDEDFSEIFKNYKGEVLIFGGSEDSAVSKKAIEVQSKLLKKEAVILNGDHYFFLNKKNRRKVIELINS